jgi:glyceraldehyde 3-phosphate dehydrogenase
MIKVAINGFGRIGRLAFRLLNENSNFEVVAINDLTDAEQLAYLLKYDTGQGSYQPENISFVGNEIIVRNKQYKVYSEKDPINLPWKALEVDVVLECTGFFLSQEGAGKHIEAGAKYVVISAPAEKGVKTVVFNVNHEILTKDDHIVSAASCTTNCLAPVLQTLDHAFGVSRGFMTTIHAFTNDQSLVDQPHRKGILSRRGRAASQNIVPSSTGAAKAIGLVIPCLKGKLDGTALRVPVLSGSIVDLTVELEVNVTVEDIHAAIIRDQSETMRFTTDPIVSSDVIGSTYSCIFDGNTTQILSTPDGRQLVKVMAWYDNEMGYTAQMVRTMAYLMQD